MERGPAKVLGLILAVLIVVGLTAYEVSVIRQSTPTGATAQSEPAPAPAAGPTPAPPQAEIAAVKPTEAVPPDAKPAEIKPADTAAATPPAALPSFDVVRVEPTGDAVVAGQAEPQAKVEVLDGAATIATAEANENGEWALALDKPLPPGTHDLAVRMTSKDNATATLSDQRVTVSVPEKGGKDVLVVVNTPDSASKVLQVPDAAVAAPAEQQVAAAPPAGAAETAPVAPAESTPAAGETTAPAAEPPAAAAAPAEQVASASTVAEPPVQGEAPVAAEPQVAAEAPVATEAPVKAEPPIKTEPPVPTEQLAAKAEPPKPEVAVAAVEADTSGSVYIAGTSKTGETVRVYLDDQALGEAKPSPSGTWLLETQKDLPAGAYTVRADQIDAAGTVIARSEVPFEREVEVAVLKPVGQAGAGTDGGATLTGAMPEMETVIIKKGDNLWRIARGTWGKGIRWSTIYQANTDQIRNPHWIYPGQVFIMPKGSVSWTD
jgi:hypothetical protein